MIAAAKTSIGNSFLMDALPADDRKTPWCRSIHCLVGSAEPLSDTNPVACPDFVRNLTGLYRTSTPHDQVLFRVAGLHAGRVPLRRPNLLPEPQPIIIDRDSTGAPGAVAQKTAEVDAFMSKILLVDDDVDLAELVKTKLSVEGHEVSVINTGEGAFEAAKQAKPDIAILDTRCTSIVNMRGSRRPSALRSTATAIPPSPTALPTGHTPGS